MTQAFNYGGPVLPPSPHPADDDRPVTANEVFTLASRVTAIHLRNIGLCAENRELKKKIAELEQVANVPNGAPVPLWEAKVLAAQAMQNRRTAGLIGSESLLDEALADLAACGYELRPVVGDV